METVHIPTLAKEKEKADRINGKIGMGKKVS